VTNDILIVKFFWIILQEKRCYTVPWFLCETSSLLVQVVGFVYYVTHKKNELDTGVLTAAIVNMGNKQPQHNEYSNSEQVVTKYISLRPN
jgi:hypothetical protein